MLEIFENEVFKNRKYFVSNIDKELSQYNQILDCQNEIEKLKEID